MELTPAGETLLHHARRVLRDVENIGIELAEHATGLRGYVRMMANLSAIVQSLPATRVCAGPCIRLAGLASSKGSCRCSVKGDG